MLINFQQIQLTSKQEPKYTNNVTFVHKINIHIGDIMKRPGRKRLSLDLPTYFYDELKKASKKKNVTVTKLLLRMIYKYILD